MNSYQKNVGTTKGSERVTEGKNDELKCARMNV